MKTDCLRIVIPSYNRPEAIKTHKILDAFGFDNYAILLHSEEQKPLYLQNKSIRPEKIVVTGEPRGISNQRRWIINKWVPKGEWFITLDDNIERFEGVHPNWYNLTELNVKAGNFDRSIFSHHVSGQEFLNRVSSDIEVCEKSGIRYGGFGSVPNYYFLGKKYRYVGYVISKAAFIKNEGQEYDPHLEAMEDFGFTAHNLFTYGRVLINNWIIPKAGHYEKGGIGTYNERVPRKIQDCEYLMQKYPGLFRYKIKTGCHPKAELQVRFTTLKQLEEWKKSVISGQIKFT